MAWHQMHSWMNNVSDGCLAMGEGTIEKISEFKVGIEPKTDVTPLAKEGKNWNKLEY